MTSSLGIGQNASRRLDENSLSVQLTGELGGAPIGQGAYGKVYPIQETSKVVKIQDDLITARRETAILIKIKEIPHIPHFHYSFEKDLHHYLVMEFVPGQTLDKISLITVDKVISITRQIFSVLLFFDKAQIVHGDLKPRNILYHEDSERVTILDFGLSFDLLENKIPTHIQTLNYRAPEVVLRYRPTTSVDLWSLGCIIYELFTRQLLFPIRKENENEYLSMIDKRLGLPLKKYIKDSSVFGDFFVYRSVTQITYKYVCKMSLPLWSVAMREHGRKMNYAKSEVKILIKIADQMLQYKRCSATELDVKPSFKNLFQNNDQKSSDKKSRNTECDCSVI